MADAYSQTISGEVATTLGDNSRKTTHATFNYGTPNIFPLVITRIDEGDWTGYANSDSDFHKVIAFIQTRAEIYGIGEIDGTNQFTILVNWNTLAQDDTTSENTGYPQTDSGDLDYLENEISNKLGIGLTIYHGKIVRDDVEYNNDC